MTTLVIPQKQNNLLKNLLIAILIAILAAVAVETCTHAVAKHGNEALNIRDCLGKNGEFQVWKSLQFDNQFFRICDLGKGKFGLQIVRLENGVWREVTAFIKGDGSWGQLVKYLGRIATKYNGALP